MDRRRLQRAALQWGGLALVAQLWVALVFLRWAWIAWDHTRPDLVSFAESVDRFSQLKAPAFKFPWAGIYLALFAAAMALVLGWIVVAGMREAMAREPDAPSDDEDPTARR